MVVAAMVVGSDGGRQLVQYPPRKKGRGGEFEHYQEKRESNGRTKTKKVGHGTEEKGKPGKTGRGIYSGYWIHNRHKRKKKMYIKKRQDQTPVSLLQCAKLSDAFDTPVFLNRYVSVETCIESFPNWAHGQTNSTMHAYAEREDNSKRAGNAVNRENPTRSKDWRGKVGVN